MIDELIDDLDAFTTRWHLVLSIISIAWFVATCAEYAGFIEIPDILPLTGWAAILPASAWNGLWWGFAYPRILARRKQRTELENANG